MNCPDLDALIAFARGRDEVVDGHVSTCTSCAEEVALLRSMVELSAPIRPPSDELLDRVMGALPSEEPELAGVGAEPEFEKGHSVLTFLMSFGTVVGAFVVAEGVMTVASVVLSASVVGIVVAGLEPRVFRLRP